MLLKLNRHTFTNLSTVGDLYVDGAFECYTLEDCVRDKKIKGVTAIPTGIYGIYISSSNKFHKELPLLLGVPGFDGIRIHKGNSDIDTEGCILVGKTKRVNFIGESEKAFAPLFAKLKAAFDRGEEIQITIS